jgi:hypothetical protein
MVRAVFIVDPLFKLFWLSPVPSPQATKTSAKIAANTKSFFNFLLTSK